MDASAIIKLLHLKPLPGEGGWYCETYRSAETLPDGGNPLTTAIYYLLTDEADCFSALHRLTGDEIYHFYLGDPLEMLLLHPEGRGETVYLGADLANGERPQLVVPAGVWQGSRVKPGGKFSLVGTTMSPGYNPAGYEGGSRRLLHGLYPRYQDLITSLTRMETTR